MLAEPKCYKRRCKHFLGVKWLGDSEETEVNFCPAFPDGIPDEIAYGKNKHNKVFPGQLGDAVFEAE